MAEFQIWS